MLRRLFKTGNSVVLSLPREILESMSLIDGDEVSLALDEDNGRRLIVTKVEKTTPATGVDADFSGHLEEFINQYRTELEELSR